MVIRACFARWWYFAYASPLYHGSVTSISSKAICGVISSIFSVSAQSFAFICGTALMRTRREFAPHGSIHTALFPSAITSLFPS